MARTRWRALAIAYLLSLLALPALFGTFLGPGEGLRVAAIMLLAVPGLLMAIGVEFVASFVHELGHYIAGRLLRLRITSVVVGGGRPVIRRRVGRTNWSLGLGAVGGVTNVEYGGAGGRLINLRFAFFVLGGPATSGAVGAGALFLGAAGDLSYVVSLILVLAGVVNVMVAVTNLLPLTTQSVTGEPIPRDGRLLLLSMARTRHGTENRDEDDDAESYAHALVTEGRVGEGAAAARRLAESTPNAERRARCLNLYAFATALEPTPATLAAARDALEEALLLVPDDVAVLDTYALVLARQGEGAQARTIASDLVSRSAGAPWEASVHGTLAFALAADGDHALAADTLRRALSLDSTDATVRAAANELTAKKCS